MTRFLEALCGPLFLKEMLEISRRRRYYAMRVGYALVLLALAYGILRKEQDVRGRRDNIRMIAEVGRQFFETAIYWQILAVHLIMPLLIAGTFCDERRRGCLDLLLLTPLSEREILFGKTGSRIVVMSLLVASGLPLLGLALLLGGTDPRQMLLAETATIAVVIGVASVSAVIAVNVPTAAEAVRRIYLYLGAMWMAGFLIATFAIVTGAFIPLFDFIPVIVWAAGLLAVFAFSGFVVAVISLRRQRATPLSDVARTAPALAGGAIDSTKPTEEHPAAEQPYQISENAPVEELLERIRSRLGWFKSDWLHKANDGCLGCVTGIGLFLGSILFLVLPIGSLELLHLELVLIAVGLSAQVALNPIFSRSFSLRDLTLLTPIDSVLLLRAALRSIVQPAQCVAVFMSVIFGMRVILNMTVGRKVEELAGALLAFGVWVLFCALCSLNGLLNSLVARTRPEAFWGAVSFPVGMAAVPLLLQPINDTLGSFPIAVVFFLAPAAAAFAWRRYRNDATCRNFNALFLAMHLALLAGLVVFPSIIASGGNATQVALASPIFWSQQAHAPVISYSSDGVASSPFDIALYAGYLTALAINIALVLWWLLRDFDRLVDRPHRTPRNPEPLAITHTEEPQS